MTDSDAVDDPAINDQLAEQILATMAEPLYVVDRHRRILLWNQAAEELTGYRADEVVGHSCRDGILNHVDECGVEQCGTNCPLSSVMNDGHERDLQVYLHHRNGHRQPVHVRATALRDDHGEIVGATEVFHDDAETLAMRHELDELSRQALTDQLTGIGNRRYLDEHLAAWLADHDRYGPGFRFGLLLIDIDHFKQVNDTYGHDLGDQVLRMVATSLAHTLRGGDVVGRWGGEEFVVLCRAADHEALAQAAARLHALVGSSRLDTASGPIRVTISVGGAHARPLDAGHALVKRADTALYRAKQAGRNRVEMG